MNIEGKLHLQGYLWNTVNNNKNEEKPGQIKHGATIKWDTTVIKKSCRRKYSKKEKIRDALIENVIKDMLCVYSMVPALIFKFLCSFLKRPRNSS